MMATSPSTTFSTPCATSQLYALARSHFLAFSCRRSAKDKAPTLSTPLLLSSFVMGAGPARLLAQSAASARPTHRRCQIARVGTFHFFFSAERGLASGDSWKKLGPGATCQRRQGRARTAAVRQHRSSCSTSHLPANACRAMRTCGVRVCARVCGSIASPLPFRVVQRQEQLERSLQQIGALNEKLAKEKLAQKEELDAAAKKIKNLQQHRDKAKELSDQVESYKEELTRFRKAEAELTKLNAKLKAEVEALAGTSPAASASPSTPFHSYTCVVCGGACAFVLRLGQQEIGTKINALGPRWRKWNTRSGCRRRRSRISRRASKRKSGPYVAVVRLFMFGPSIQRSSHLFLLARRTARDGAGAERTAGGCVEESRPGGQRFGRRQERPRHRTLQAPASALHGSVRGTCDRPVFSPDAPVCLWCVCVTWPQSTTSAALS